MNDQEMFDYYLRNIERLKKQKQKIEDQIYTLEFHINELYSKGNVELKEI